MNLLSSVLAIVMLLLMGKQLLAIQQGLDEAKTKTVDLIINPQEATQSYCEKKEFEKKDCSLRLLWSEKGEIKDVCQSSYKRWFPIRRYYYLQLDCMILNKKVIWKTWKILR